MDNLVGLLFTNLATIYDSVMKIVTKTDILALVSLLLGIYFIWYCPTFGDILNDNYLLIITCANSIIECIYTFSQAHFGSKQSNVIVIAISNCQLSITPGKSSCRSSQKLHYFRNHLEDLIVLRVPSSFKW